MWGKKNGKQFTHTFNCHHHRRAAMTRPAEARKRFERKSNNKTVHPNTAAVKRQGRKKKRHRKDTRVPACSGGTVLPPTRNFPFCIHPLRGMPSSTSSSSTSSLPSSSWSSAGTLLDGNASLDGVRQTEKEGSE